jgi:Zn-finger nucleic acid-binding protein
VEVEVMRYLFREGGEPADEREHFDQCPDCGAWLDLRELGQVLAHEEACAGSPARPN